MILFPRHTQPVHQHRRMAPASTPLLHVCPTAASPPPPPQLVFPLISQHTQEMLFFLRLSLNRSAYLEASSNGDVSLACACPAAARFGEQLPRSAPCSRTSPQAGGYAAGSGARRNCTPASARGLRCPWRCRAGRSSRGASKRYHCEWPQPRVAQGGGTRRQQPRATTGSWLQLLGHPWMGKVPLPPPCTLPS